MSCNLTYLLFIIVYHLSRTLKRVGGEKKNDIMMNDFRNKQNSLVYLNTTYSSIVTQHKQIQNLLRPKYSMLIVSLLHCPFCVQEFFSLLIFSPSASRRRRVQWLAEKRGKMRCTSEQIV